MGELSVLSREQLVSLRDRLTGTSADHESADRLIFELQLQQVQLELKNRELGDAQERLLASHAHLAELYEQAPVGYLTLDRHGLIRQCNQRAAELFGERVDALVGTPFASVARLTRSPEYWAHLRTCFQTGRPLTAELWVGPQARRWVAQLISTPVLVAGQATVCQTVVFDVTDRHRAQAGLRFLSETSAHLGASLNERTVMKEAAALALSQLADGCRVTLREQPAEEAWVERTAVQALAGEEARGVEAMEARSMANGEPEVAAYAAGALQRAWVFPLTARGEVFGTLALLHLRPKPPTVLAELALAEEFARRCSLALENARLYARARAAMRTRDEFLGMVSHDLRSGVFGLRLGISNLLQGHGPESKRAAMLQNLYRTVDWMGELISNLLVASAIESGQLPLAKVSSEVAPLLEAAAELVRINAQARAVAVAVECPALPLRVLCDPARVGQVLHNLLGNAIKFSPENGAVGLEAAAAADAAEVIFSVADTGPGIPQEQLPHLFDRYWQAKAGGEQGVGLGLSIAKWIVEAHGGRIWAETAVGRGSRFRFSLPCVPAPQAVS